MARNFVRRRALGVKNRAHPLFMVWLTCMWVLLQGELSVANVIGGVLVACLVVFSLPLPAMPLGGISVSWLRLAGFLLRWIGEFMEASCKVAWLAIRPADPPRTAIVEAPMRVESEFVLSLAVMLYNLQPGGCVTDIDIANRRLTVHLLDGHDEDAIARELASLAHLEEEMIAIFERRVG